MFYTVKNLSVCLIFVICLLDYFIFLVYIFIEDILIENVRYIIDKNPENNDRLSPVLEYLENIMKVKADRMKRIWYFETDGSSDHYPVYKWLYDF